MKDWKGIESILLCMSGLYFMLINVIKCGDVMCEFEYLISDIGVKGGKGMWVNCGLVVIKKFYFWCVD